MAPALLALLVLAGPHASSVTPDTIPPDTRPGLPFLARVSVSATAGTIGAGDLQRQPVLAERLDEEGEVASSSVLARRLTTTDGLQLHVSARIALDDSWAVRVGAGRGRARLRQELDGPDAALVREAGSLPVEGSPGLRLGAWDAALQYRIPSARRVRPYMEVGLGAERWATRDASDPPFPGGEGVATPVRRYASHAAIGGEWALGRGLSLRLQGSLRAFRTPLPPAPAGTAVAAGDTLRLTLEPHQAGVFADRAVELTRVIRLDAGLSYGFGVREPARQPPPAPDASPSVPRP